MRKTAILFIILFLLGNLFPASLIIVSADDDLPIIGNVQATPSSVSQGGYVNITCDVTVTDIVSVDKVYLNITNPDESWSNVSMDAVGSDGYYYNATYILVGNYSYFIWANDTSGNSNMSASYQFYVNASGAPSIIDNSSDSVGTDDSFVLNATVTDSDGVDGVWIEYWFDGGSKTNKSMTQVVAADYYEKTINITSDSTDDLWYNISANDTYDVWGHLNNQQVVVSDDDPPTIDNVQATPDSAIQDGYVNITCDVGDNVDVDEVMVNITYPDSSYHNETMLEGSYYYNATYILVGNYSYFIWANDSSGNSNISLVHSFVIQDTTLPEITDIDAQPDPQETGRYVNITCDVTDNEDVGEVWVNITYPDGSYHNETMLDTLDGLYYYNVSSYTILGTYDYFIWANDSSGNVNSSPVYNFTIYTLFAYVDDGYIESTPGWNITYFDNIQDGIDAVAEDGAVYVFNGTYYENVVVDKTINLTGENRDSTIIDGGGNGDVVYVSANMVNATGLTLTGGESACGVKLSNAHNCFIFNNNVTSNRDGVYLSYSSNNNISDNFISSNTERGIILEYTNNNCIFNNYVSSNKRGMESWKSSYNTISCNTISSNYQHGILLWSSPNHNNTIYNNYFDNVNNAIDYGNNVWNFSKTEGTNIVGGPHIGGNYWSDYTGIDKNPKDGLGDSPYSISGVNADKYPLYFNATPLQRYENPLNGSANVSLQPVCSITVSDPDTDSLTVYFYENNNGSWILQQNFSANSGSAVLWDKYSNASNYNELYLWSVNVTDGYSWSNETYHFTIKPPDIVYVDDDYNYSTEEWQIDHFDNIQDGIDNISENGTIFVYGGIYRENVIIYKSITLQSGSSPVINGAGDIGITITANNAIVQDMTLTNCSTGIKIHNDSSILHNTILSNNTVYSNTQHGIHLVSSNDNALTSNYVYNNPNGIYLEDSSNNAITLNNIHNNSEIGICLISSSENNSIYHNNFADNMQNNSSYDECHYNSWDDTEYGNYWDDYSGEDNGGDGIGDTPHNISGGNNNDSYPLVYQFENYFTLPITAPSSVNEGDTFTVTIKNLLDVNIQGASVAFNSKTKTTNSAGRATFTAPPVGSNKVYKITVIKTGYIGNSKTITVKNVPPSGDGDDNYYYDPLPPEPTNQKPVADASASETFGFVGTPVTFDGSRSYDPDEDGYIASGHWDFGDGTNFTAKIVAHTYSNSGTYTVTLTVTDNNGTTDTCEIIVVISQANRPPSNPVIDGHTNGSKSTEYMYVAVSTDLDDHDVRYVFNWDDGTDNAITDFLENGTIGNATHIWESAGVYLVMAYAEDEYNATSGTTELMVFIDVQVKFIDDVVEGYLIDYECDGTYNAFHNNLTKDDTAVELQDNGRYLIDINGSGTWDYTYDPATGTINSMKEKETIEKTEISWVLVLGITLIIAIIAIIILFKIGYISIEEIPSAEIKKKTGGKNNKKGKN